MGVNNLGLTCSSSQKGLPCIGGPCMPGRNGMLNGPGGPAGRMPIRGGIPPIKGPVKLQAL